MRSNHGPIGGHSSRTTGAVVIGGDYRTLGVVRSLGRRGIPVWVLRGDELIATSSKFARRSLPWIDGDDESQVNYLLRLAARYGLDGWMIFPTGDESAVGLARNHARLSQQFNVTTPGWEMIRWFYDKRLTYSLASKLGVDHPWTCYPRNREEVEVLSCRFPVILKPAIKQTSNSFTETKAWRVDDHRDLVARYDEACRLVDPDVIMVQELIRGNGDQYSYAALCLDGRPLASALTGHNRQWPLDFGRYSTYAETVEHPTVEQAARRLLAEIHYTGLAQVQFKFDPRDGRYKVLDVNPRIWGSHTLCQRAGVDFPYLLWRLHHGQEVHEVRAQPGVRWVRMTRDLPAAAYQIRGGQLSPASYLRSLRGPIGFAIFAADDLAPALLDVPLMIYTSLRRRYSRPKR